MPTPDWLAKPTLTGQLVQLRPFAEDDLPAMAEALTDPDVMKLTGSVHSWREAAARRPGADEAFLAWYRTRNQAEDRLDLAIVDLKTRACVGEAVLNDYSQANSSCNFRILIGPKGRDRGLGSEATTLMIRYGLDVLGLHRIELSVYSFNPRAQRVYEKTGFQVEGRLRHAFRFDDEWIDTVLMSVLATD
ncbi:MAG TPA: GNAT family protein [Acidimicrobiales bacterium]|jgi:RimJ/RimL family protein N-acetyltransferase|nr:GNAT family protein [Acidimicrobiales bacterium]